VPETEKSVNGARDKAAAHERGGVRATGDYARRRGGGNMFARAVAVEIFFAFH